MLDGPLLRAFSNVLVERGPAISMLRTVGMLPAAVPLFCALEKHIALDPTGWRTEDLEPVYSLTNGRRLPSLHASEFDPRILFFAACLAVVVAVGLAMFEDPRLRQTLLALR